jgi:hypothetical protein
VTGSGEQPGDDFDRHATADQLGGVRVTQYVHRERDPGARGDTGGEPVHGRVTQRLPDPPAEQVDEHVLSRTRRYLELMPVMCF